MCIAFVGTTDLSIRLALVAYIGSFFLALLGYVFSCFKMFVPYHQIITTLAVIASWPIFLFLMTIVSCFFVPTALKDLGKPDVYFPLFYLCFGGISLILGTLLVLSMWFEKQRIFAWHFKSIRFSMRLILACWLMAAILDLCTYLCWFVSPFTKLSPG